MNEQIKKLEFKNWFCSFMEILDDTFVELENLGKATTEDFPYPAMLYLTDMFWKEVSLKTKDCETQKEYEQIINQLTEKEIIEYVTPSLKKNGYSSEQINEILESLNIPFTYY